MVRIVALLTAIYSPLTFANLADVNLTAKLEEARENASKDEKAQRQILGSLYTINQKMKTMSKKREHLNDRMLSAKGDVQGLAKGIAVLESKIKSQRAVLSLRLRELFRRREGGPIQTLLSAGDVFEFDRNLKFLKIVADRDYQLIKDYEENVRVLAERRDQLKSKVKKLVGIERELEKQEALLSETQTSKAALLARLKVQHQEALEKIKGLKKTAIQVQAMALDPRLSQLLEDSFSDGKGKLKPPVQGELVQGYGVLHDDEFKFNLSHKGLFWRAKKNSEVRTVWQASVRFAGELAGQGQTVILDHGDHYYTVYAHNEKVLVKMGERVKQGQVIALSGSSSTKFGPGIYFEVRHFSDAIDPMAWIARNETKDDHEK